MTKRKRAGRDNERMGVKGHAAASVPRAHGVPQPLQAALVPPIPSVNKGFGGLKISPQQSQQSQQSQASVLGPGGLRPNRLGPTVPKRGR